MAELARADAKEFRMAAPRIFIFLVGVIGPCYVGATLLKYGFRLDWLAFLLGAGAMVPMAIILAGLASMCFPVRLTAEGIHAQSVWGTASFVRWQDITTVHSVTLLNLRWLRIRSKTDRAVTWLALFQSPSAEFRHELERLAPPNSPVLGFLE
jgi:hypothetical protein